MILVSGSILDNDPYLHRLMANQLTVLVHCLPLTVDFIAPAKSLTDAHAIVDFHLSTLVFVCCRQRALLGAVSEAELHHTCGSASPAAAVRTDQLHTHPPQLGSICLPSMQLLTLVTM